MKKYPRMGTRSKVRPQGLCVICDAPKSDRRVEIQVNWFRGDDDVYKVHSECMGKFDEVWRTWYTLDGLTQIGRHE